MYVCYGKHLHKNLSPNFFFNDPITEQMNMKRTERSLLRYAPVIKY